MAGPISAGVAGKIQGLREAKAAFQALPTIVRDNMLVATETTVKQIARIAQGRLQSSPSIRTRALYNSVAWKVTKTNGRGIAGVSQGTGPVKPSSYAHFVEFGTRKMAAEPFMIPAAESQKHPYLERCRHAGKGIEKDMSHIGMRAA